MRQALCLNPKAELPSVCMELTQTCAPDMLILAIFCIMQGLIKPRTAA